MLNNILSIIETIASYITGGIFGFAAGESIRRFVLLHNLKEDQTHD